MYRAHITVWFIDSPFNPKDIWVTKRRLGWDEPPKYMIPYKAENSTTNKAADERDATKPAVPVINVTLTVMQMGDLQPWTWPSGVQNFNCGCTTQIKNVAIDDYPTVQGEEKHFALELRIRSNTVPEKATTLICKDRFCSSGKGWEINLLLSKLKKQ